MKIKLLLFLVTFFIVSDLNSQIQYLRLSPSQKIEQRIGATDITLEYSRPQMKDREIFGSLVPYNKMWRTGANENTIISFSHRVKIDNEDIAKGSYALMTKPHKEKWEIYFYKDIKNLDVPNPIDSSNLIYLTTVESRQLNEDEKSLTINFHDITETSVNLSISWEKTSVKVPIEFYTREAMELAMEKEFKQNALDYSIAATYYQQRDIELDKAKKLREISMSMKDKPNAWDLNSYGIILFKLGQKEEAKGAIEKSLLQAKESKNQYLINENQKLLKAWFE